MKCIKKMGEKNFKLYQAFMCLTVLNIFSLINQKNFLFELYQIFMYNLLCQNDKIFTKILSYIKSLCGKKFQYSQILYKLKALLSKNWFYFFFHISHAKSPLSSRMPCYKH